MSKICKLHKAEQHKKHVHELHKGITGHEKGVHIPTALNPGQSTMGSHVRQPSNVGHGSKEMARRHARVVGKEIKSIKPNLDKSIYKHEEGFHNGAADEEGKGFEHPDDEDNRTDDCAYCQDLDAEENADGTAGMHEGCPACADYDAQNGTSGGDDGCQMCADYDSEQSNDGCAACDDYDSQSLEQAGTPAEQGAEDHHQCNCPNCPKKDETGLAIEDMTADHPDDCEECQNMYSDAIENEPGQTGQEDPNMQGHETAEEVLDLLDQEPGKGKQTPEAAAKKIDDTELPQGDQMKGNDSVTEDFGPTQEAEVSDSENEFGEPGHDCDCPDCPGSQQAQPMDQEESQDDQDQPDMAGILQDGLDDHINEQKKQQVLDMVGQTLASFKANKVALEQSKEQNQGLYSSCIQMLKSMIELCKLMGLEPKMPQSSPQTPPTPDDGGQQPEESPETAPQGSFPPKKAMGQV